MDAASHRAAKTRPVPLTRLPLITRLLAATGSRHTTQPAHAGVSGHHTTVSPLLFMTYPQTQVPAPSVPGPCADTTAPVPFFEFFEFLSRKNHFLSFSRRKKIIFIIFTTILIQRNPFYHFYDDFNTFFHFVAESSPPPRERSDGARARSTACVLFAASHTHHGNENNVVSLISHRNSLTKISKRCILNDQAL